MPRCGAITDLNEAKSQLIQVYSSQSMLMQETYLTRSEAMYANHERDLGTKSRGLAHILQIKTSKRM